MLRVNSAWVAIDLTRFEQAEGFTGDFVGELGALQQRLAELHLAQVVHRRRAIILFEGWEGSGKRRALRALAAALDPCHVRTHCALSDESGRSERHWLAPYWASLPEAGFVGLHYRSWYRHAVDGKALGRLTPKEFGRACDAVNEFENQQTEYGTPVVKLFFHVSGEVQGARLRARREDPWARHLLSAEDSRGLELRGAYFEAWTECFAQTDTRWAPWTVINAGDGQGGVIAAMRAAVTALEKAIPAEPPAAVAPGRRIA